MQPKSKIERNKKVDRERLDPTEKSAPRLDNRLIACTESIFCALSSNEFHINSSNAAGKSHRDENFLNYF